MAILLPIICLTFAIAGTYFVANNMMPPLLTPEGNFGRLKTIFESIIVVLFIMSLTISFQKRRYFDSRVFLFIFSSIILALGSEIAITLSTNESNMVSILGLNFKILSYYLIFQTILVTGFAKPQTIFYRGLQTDWEQLQNLINSLNEGIGIINRQDQFIFSNPAADKIFGLEKGELIKHKVSDIFTGQELEKYNQQKNILMQNEASRIELEFIHPQNGKRSLVATASPQITGKTLSAIFLIFHDITEIKKENEKVEEARRLYQTLFMDAPIRIWENDYSRVKKEIDLLKERGVKDFKTFFKEHPELVKKFSTFVKINNYNKKVIQQYNVRDKKETIKSLSQIFWESSYPYFISELLAIAEGKTSINFEMTTRTITGEIYYSIINWAVLPDHEKDYSRIIISADDITARKNAQMELQASEEKFRLLAQNAGVGISYYDLSGNIIFLNDKAREQIGLIDLNNSGKNISEIFDQEWVTVIKDRIEEVSKSDSTFQYQDKLSFPDGDKWYSLYYSRILNSQGNCIGIQIISHDITKQKTLEDELQSLARFPEENPHPVLRLAHDGSLTYTNLIGNKILRIWKYPEHSSIPKSIKKIVNNCLDKDKPEIIEVNAGKSIYSLYITPIREMGYVNIYGRDITELKTIQAKLLKYSKGLEKIVDDKTTELVQAQERLVSQEKLATMGQMAGSVGHELRNPLAVINNALFILKSKAISEDQTSSQYLDIIDQEVASANRIITDLLTFARIKPANLNPTKPQSMIDNVLQKFVPPENVTVTTSFEDDLPIIHIDNNQVEQVIANLLINAYQAMPIGGDLIISGEVKNDLVRLKFTDTGVGIPKENFKKIFDPLFTTKPKGIGLGLTVSKILIEINGGKIEVNSKVGKGSTFILDFPINNTIKL